MPLYDVLCNSCEKVHEQQHRMADKPGPCPHCKSKDTQHTFLSIARAYVLDRGWEAMNGGKGNYIGQLADKPNVKDPNAYCRSRREAIEKARAKFNTVIT